MTKASRVVGVFHDEEECVRAIEELRRVDLGKPRVFSPFASEEILEALHEKQSPVRRWVLIGGLSGCASGFALTAGLSAEYPHVTAAMPIVSIPPFVIIAFELTILFGALAGLVGFLAHGRFPRTQLQPGYNPRFSADRFGVLLECAAADVARVEQVFREAGATEITHESL